MNLSGIQRPILGITWGDMTGQADSGDLYPEWDLIPLTLPAFQAES